MAGAAPGNPVRKAVEFSVAPKSHLWVVVCLGSAGTLFGAAIFLGLGELVYTTQRLLLEALLTLPPQG